MVTRRCSLFLPLLTHPSTDHGSHDGLPLFLLLNRQGQRQIESDRILFTVKGRSNLDPSLAVCVLLFIAGERNLMFSRRIVASPVVTPSAFPSTTTTASFAFLFPSFSCRSVSTTTSSSLVTMAQEQQQQDSSSTECCRSDGVRITHDPFAPGLAEKYGLPGETDPEGFVSRPSILITSLVLKKWSSHKIRPLPLGII